MIISSPVSAESTGVSVLGISAGELVGPVDSGNITGGSS